MYVFFYLYCLLLYVIPFPFLCTSPTFARQWSAKGRNPTDLCTPGQEAESETKYVCYWLFRQTNLQIRFLGISVTTKGSEAHSVTKAATPWKQNLKRKRNHTVFQMHYSPIKVQQLVMLICYELQQRHLWGACSSLTQGTQRSHRFMLLLLLQIWRMRIFFSELFCTDLKGKAHWTKLPSF